MFGQNAAPGLGCVAGAGDHIGAGLGHLADQRRQVAGPIVDRRAQQDVAPLLDQHLLDHPRQ